MLGWCHELGIREVTLYAFSIENFKRSPEEVRIPQRRNATAHFRLACRLRKIRKIHGAASSDLIASSPSFVVDKNGHIDTLILDPFPSQVDGLMDLARVKLAEVLDSE